MLFKNDISGKQLNFLVALLAVVVLSIGIKYRFLDNPNTDGTVRFIDGDGKGYYAYLPAAIIHRDLSFSFYEKDTVNFGYNYSNTFLINHNGININKYTCGEAILLLPFFLLAVLWSYIFHMPIDGYNQAFQLFFALGSFFYLILGLVFTKKFIQQYNLSNKATAIGITALVLGTNLLNYTINESSMSHVFSFSLIAAHAFYIKKSSSSLSLKNSILTGITLGLLILVRPVNLVIVFAYPFLWNQNILFFFQKSTIRKLIPASLLTLLMISIQLIAWKIESGSYIVYSYKNEGFYFNKPPHFFDYLFGFRRGAFIYSPALFFSLIGLYFLWKRNTKEFIFLLLFLLLLIYVHASWWSWYYGDGFGERPLVDFYALFALLIALAINEIKRKFVKFIAGILFITSIVLHQVFFYQYYHYIIHPESMNYEKFKYVFFKTDKKFEGIFKCGPEDFYYPNGIRVVDSAGIDFTKNKNTASKILFNPNNLQPNGYHILHDNYLPQAIFTTDTGWLNKPRFAEFYIDYIQPKDDTAAYHIYFMIECLDSLDKTKWFTTSSVLSEKFNCKVNTKINAFERLKIGVSKNVGDRIKVYIFNPDNKELVIEKLNIKIIEANN